MGESDLSGIKVCVHPTVVSIVSGLETAFVQSDLSEEGFLAVDVALFYWIILLSCLFCS